MKTQIGNSNEIAFDYKSNHAESYVFYFHSKIVKYVIRIQFNAIILIDTIKNNNVTYIDVYRQTFIFFPKETKLQ